MKLRYLGHSCFHLQTSSASLVFDPFLRGNPGCPAELTPATLPCDYIIVSHGHEDHCCDALELALANSATLIANFEIAEYFAAKGAKTHGMNPGGAFRFPFGRVKCVPARHSSSLGSALNPIYMGEACGFLVEVDDRRLYFAGDTALFLDMQLIGKGGLDLAFLPIGDNFTMGPEDALDALDILRPGLCVPMHYDTWPVIRQDARAFAKAGATRGHRIAPLSPGESLEF